MVPINFYKYREELKNILLSQVQSALENKDLFNVAWICYAFCAEGIENNRQLIELYKIMQRYIEEERELWDSQRNLGPIGAVLWLQRKLKLEYKKETDYEFIKRIKKLKSNDKLSPLCNPEQFFLLTLGVKQIGDKETQDYIKQIALQEMRRGPLRRRIIYASTLRILGESVVCPQGSAQDETDVIAIVWWAELYDENKYECWEKFSSIHDQIAIDAEHASSIKRILSITDMAILYEAVVKETNHPEPKLLFEYFPLHPRIKQLARQHFFNGDYIAGIFESTKALNELIQQRTGITDKSEVQLVQATMKQTDAPSKLKIKFNAYLDTTSGKNEQSGLELICEGVFKAFRNPKGHVPQDHALLKIDPYDALEQLGIISYLFKRIESANIDK
jgi:uncharacterized protein (TIGR02391 family)